MSEPFMSQFLPKFVSALALSAVEVENQGSRQATDVSVGVLFPESLMPANDGQSSEQPENHLTFSESVVAPGQKVTFKFTAIGVAKGDHVVRCTLRAAGSERQVISENSVYVYEVSEARRTIVGPRKTTNAALESRAAPFSASLP
jgi:hypothetical protein